MYLILEDFEKIKWFCTALSFLYKSCEIVEVVSLKEKVTFRNKSQNQMKLTIQERFFTKYKCGDQDTVYEIDKKLLNNLNNLHDVKSLAFIVNYQVVSSSSQKRPFLLINKELDDYAMKANIGILEVQNELMDDDSTVIDADGSLFHHKPTNLSSFFEMSNSFKLNETLTFRFSTQGLELSGDSHKDRVIHIERLFNYGNLSYYYQQNLVRIKQQKRDLCIKGIPFPTFLCSKKIAEMLDCPIQMGVEIDRECNAEGDEQPFIDQDNPRVLYDTDITIILTNSTQDFTFVIERDCKACFTVTQSIKSLKKRRNQVVDPNQPRIDEFYSIDNAPTYINPDNMQENVSPIEESKESQYEKRDIKVERSPRAIRPEENQPREKRVAEENILNPNEDVDFMANDLNPSDKRKEGFYDKLAEEDLF
ncbi:unnamed protein product [Moneuplotes crassus]|uniref:Uncharacterized protein n=1 Tax=Euplotes crassus TaxID=5936 RepID=A0AAD1UF76_EUPCR|nr:unnamed protein product [Moneuplotes crassus]